MANAGPDQYVLTGIQVTLDASGSNDADGDTLTYTWSFTSRPASSSATLSSATAVNPTFTADKDGAYVLSLVVNDGTVNSAADAVTIVSGITNPNSAPVANAGPDQYVLTGTQVTLDASGSSDADGDTLTYSWSFTSKPAGSTATLSSATAVSPTFTADKDGAYVLSLVVNDGTVNSAADAVTIVSDITNSNSAPIANAGPDQFVPTGTQVTLDASGSSDADSDALTYSWSFTSKPAGSTATLSSATAVNPTFTADKDGAYALSLVVNDGMVNSAADAVTISTSINSMNSAPIANAGPDQNVSTGTVVTLDGSGSSDADGDSLTYTWSFTLKPASSTATLSSATAVNPTFTADRDGLYMLSLVVNDGHVDGEADSVTIIAATENSAPVANAGPDQNVSTGTVVTLDGGGSSDADGDTLTYTWSFTSKPASSTATLSSATVVNPTFTADKDGAYVLSLLVNDGQVDSTADSVTITAATANSAPMANAGPDQTVVLGALVTLDGSGSSDADDDTLTYNWSFTSKPASSTVTLSDAIVSNPTFTADKLGSYVLSLVVNDGLVSSAADTVTVTAINPVSLPDTGQTTKHSLASGEDADYTINPPSYTDNGDGTITDDVTGLIWQKQDDATTREWADANTYCGNNTPGLPGTGWRLPSRMELVSIVNYGTYGPAIDSTYFPNTQSWYYWSSSTWAGYPSIMAWRVNFNYGYTGINDMLGSLGMNYVRCVRGPSLALSYTDNGDGTVTDNVTGLMWQQQDDAITRNWENALSYCEALSLAGYTDWRLPNVKELNSLVDNSRYDTAIYPVFTGTKSSYYWSSTTDISDTTRAGNASFNYGDADFGSKLSSSEYVRCVRGGQ